MNDERCDRDRVTAIQAEHGNCEESTNGLCEVPWLCDLALEALDTIDRLEDENAELRRKDMARVHYENRVGRCVSCAARWPCPTWQALNPTDQANRETPGV